MGCWDGQTACTEKPALARATAKRAVGIHREVVTNKTVCVNAFSQSNGYSAETIAGGFPGGSGLLLDARQPSPSGTESGTVGIKMCNRPAKKGQVGTACCQAALL